MDGLFFFLPPTLILNIHFLNGDVCKMESGLHIMVAVSLLLFRL